MAATSAIPSDFTDADYTRTGATVSPAGNTRASINMTTQNNQVSTNSGYNLTNSSISIRTLNFPQGSMNFELRASNGASTVYRVIGNTGGTGNFTITNGTSTQVNAGTPFTNAVAKANRWWRWRHSGTTMVFEAASDASFSTIGYTWSQTPAIAITNLFLYIYQNQSGITPAGTWQFQELNGVAPVDPPATFIRSAGAETAAAGAVSPLGPPVPPWLVTGDISILTVQGKQTTLGTIPTVTTPAGWTIIGALNNNGNTTAAADTGSNYVAMYYRTDTGYSAPSITTTGFTSAAAQITAFGNSIGNGWDAPTSTTGSDASSAANLSMTGAANLSLATDDMVVVGVGVSGDIGDVTGMPTLTATGANIDTANQAANAPITTGLDSRIVVAHAGVYSGASSAAPVLGLTNASSTTGQAQFVRLRPTAATPPSARFDGVLNYHRHANHRAASY